MHVLESCSLLKDDIVFIHQYLWAYGLDYSDIGLRISAYLSGITIRGITIRSK